MLEEPTEYQPELPKSPETLEPTADNATQKSLWMRFCNWYGLHKKWVILATLIIILFLAILPLSRYKAAGLIIKKDFTVEVLDSVSHKPVSNAIVSTGRLSTQTDGNGRAKLKLSVGKHLLLIDKKYYKKYQTSVLVPILSQKKVPAITIQATGRQTKIIVKNLINQKTLSGVEIKVSDISAKTDKNGEAIVVLPPNITEQKASLSLNGYNSAEVIVKISNNVILENNFSLTPSGKVYFLSTQSGRLDVMKSNLDGTQPEVVVAGTGYEYNYQTELLPSPDWKYIALLTSRTANYAAPQLYILSTSDDQLLTVDNTNADFSLAGWSGDNLIYTVSQQDLPSWRPGINKLKSYNAATGKTTLLDQSSAAGNSTASISEYYVEVIVSGEKIIFAKNWYAAYDEEMPSGLQQGKEHTLSSISPNGQNYKKIASFPINEDVSYNQLKPRTLVIKVSGETDKFYEYNFDSTSLRMIDNFDSQNFYDVNTTFYISPSGNKTLWAEWRNGKYVVFVGDANGSNQVKVIEEYTPYGWYNDNYILVTKYRSELYIMDSVGGKPIKIADFEPTSAYFY
jgi:hypothetical protein